MTNYNVMFTLVTLHGRFTISVLSKTNKEIWWHYIQHIECTYGGLDDSYRCLLYRCQSPIYPGPKRASWALPCLRYIVVWFDTQWWTSWRFCTFRCWILMEITFWLKMWLTKGHAINDMSLTLKGPFST